MIVLGIETAGPEGTLALLRDGAPPREVTFAASRRLGAELAPAIRRLLKSEGLGPHAPPDLIAVDVGPGSYTGLRIGLAAAKGLAFAWGLPLVGVDALEALYVQVGGSRAAAFVLCALDASRGEVFATLYRRAGERERTDEPALHRQAELAATLPTGTLVVGDAAPSFVDAARGVTAAPPELAWPRARTIAELGRRKHLDGARQDALDLCPTYYRPNEAEVQRRKRSMRAT